VEIDGHHAKLRIRNDTGHPSIKQWFYFKATGSQGTVYTYTILNAREASYPRTLSHILPDPLPYIKCRDPPHQHYRDPGLAVHRQLFSSVWVRVMAETRESPGPALGLCRRASLPLFVPILL
jgi:hypothetical protein